MTLRPPNRRIDLIIRADESFKNCDKKLFLLLENTEKHKSQNVVLTGGIFRVEDFGKFDHFVGKIKKIVISS